MNETSYGNNQKKELMILAIDLEQNEKKFLKIYNDTNPEELAYNFCYKNNLDFNSMNSLIEEIRKVFKNKNLSINKVIEEKEKVFSEKNDNLIRNTNEKIIDKNILFQNLNKLKDKKINSTIDKNKIIKRNNSGRKLNKSYHSATISSLSKRKENIIKNDYSNEKKESPKIYDYNSKKESATYSLRKKNKKLINSKSNLPSDQLSLLFNEYNNEKINYGEKLYYDNMKKEEKKIDKINKLINEKENKIKNECTFKPKINKTQYHSLSTRFNNIFQYDDNDNIINYNDYKNSKLSNLRKKYNQDDKNCYFKPLINEIKEDKNKNNLTPRYELLYQNSKQLKSKREFLSNSIYNNSFKPIINKIYNTEMTNLPFNERQNIFNSKSSEKKMKMKKNIENNIDSITGQKLFKPQINDNNKLKRNSNNIFNDLYLDYQKQIVKKQKVEKDLKDKFINSENFVNNQSNEIYTKRKINSFNTIFHILDKDQDNIISKFNININGLSKNIKEILTPIFEEIKENDLSLNKDNFYSYCNKLFDNLNYSQKQEILNYPLIKKNNKNKQSNFTFKPKITNNINPNIYYEKQKKEEEKYNNYYRNYLNNEEN